MLKFFPLHGQTVKKPLEVVLFSVSGQCGGSVTLCAASSNHGVLHAHSTLGPYNTEHLLTFLDDLRSVLLEH